MINFKNVTLDAQADIDYWNKIYVEAFPAYERAPLEDLLSLANETEEVLMQIICDDDKQVGIILLTNMAPEKAFILYLAMDADQRGQGYGSMVLPALQEIFPAGLILETEELDAAADNATQRERRYGFYQRNGMLDSSFMSYSLGGIFHLMRSTDSITTDDYLKALDYLNGIPALVFNKSNVENVRKMIQ
ncbi:GNAT family N-acetyltransferase [Weissella tructae]|uniref:Acetyltransferase n=2 Tax=Weissella TaxID=46255 RepID=A0A075TZB3_9LACO|nr:MULTISPECIES: GNAT family N-acetyltransferase [Weissella]AIG65631.1 Acetyltransferase [Weissella tructae]AIM62946.1 Acetyltransferase [Weissella ceti]AIM64344.1 Acetyltransferase [Weissella ceti]ELA06915.1 acetyltransferase [Weissella ceti NC36]QVV90753.1 GNAT family N-acetyltransferase [Weissella tructae]